jgi:hypothetical protein
VNLALLIPPAKLSLPCATQKLSPGLCGHFFKPVFMIKTTENVP